jgi:hypothetical protein
VSEPNSSGKREKAGVQLHHVEDKQSEPVRAGIILISALHDAVVVSTIIIISRNVDGRGRFTICGKDIPGRCFEFGVDVVEARNSVEGVEVDLASRMLTGLRLPYHMSSCV